MTPRLQEQFRSALKLVRGAVRKGASEAAYLHGSFGAGKSHFLTCCTPSSTANRPPAAPLSYDNAPMTTDAASAISSSS
ncbi:hypothetical protein [Streptomyces prasinus]